MTLLPNAVDEQEIDEIINEDATELNEVAVTKTYKLDFETGRLIGVIDEVDALKQFIVKAILTPRSELPIYTEDYGSEIEELLGETATPDYIEAEIPRMARESIEDDDRIISVDDIQVERKGDAVIVNVNADSIYGRISEEVTLVV